MAWPSSSTRSKTWGTEILTSSDLQTQLDLLHAYFNDSLNASTGHAHTGGTSDGPKISLTAGVQNTLPIANGGTGVTSLTALMNLSMPIGTLYTNMSDSTNPATLLGFGTWTAITDRIIIGVGSTFDTALDTGGATTVTLGKGNIPAHVHTVATTSSGSGSIPAVNGSADSSINTGNGVADGLKTSPDAVAIMNPWIAGYMWYRTA